MNQYESMINKSIGILHAYGELDNFMNYSKEK